MNDNESQKTAKFKYTKNSSSNQSFRNEFNTKKKDKVANPNEMQENEAGEVFEFSFANNINYREIRQISDKSSSSKRESLSDSLQIAKNKEQIPKFPSRNIILKDFSSKALTNTINNIRKKDQQNINSINNTFSFSNIKFNNKSSSNYSKDNFARISSGIYPTYSISKYSLKNQKKDRIRIKNNNRDNLGKNIIKPSLQINKNNTQKKRFEFNNKSNTKKIEIEAGTNNTNNSATSLNEEIRSLISAIKSSNELMEIRQKNIDENFAKLLKTQEITNNNIIETNNMLKVFLESKGISLKNDMKISKNIRWRK
jgi:hypothetical protein